MSQLTKFFLCSIVGTLAVGLAMAPSANAGGEDDVRVPQYQFALLADRAVRNVIAETQRSTPSLAEDEHDLYMLDALVADCLENGVAIHHPEGAMHWEEAPSEEECFEWATRQLAGGPEDAQDHVPPVGSPGRGTYCDGMADLFQAECLEDINPELSDEAAAVHCGGERLSCRAKCMAGESC